MRPKVVTMYFTVQNLIFLSDARFEVPIKEDKHNALLDKFTSWWQTFDVAINAPTNTSISTQQTKGEGGLEITIVDMKSWWRLVTLSFYWWWVVYWNTSLD